jgi:RHS repeat-associated protein
VWQYNIGSGGGAGWRNFTPVEGDRLLGEMNSATQTATTFRGQSTVISGINAGYAVGDLDIEAFRYNGAASTGNLSVTGTHFATRAGTTAYTWDTRGRLTGATTIDTSSRTIAQTAYQYDVQDRRIGRTENSEGMIVDRDRYLYQGEHVAAVASDSDGDGNYRITDRYLHSMATDAVLSIVSSVEATGASLNAPTTASLTSADLLWTLTDHLGSVRDVVSAGGSIVRQHINYDAFGNRVGEVHRSSTGALINSDSTAAVDALFGYAGREWDDSIDLQYNRARWYDPATGRFISQDPIGFEAGDANLYRYVGNGVMTKTDPSGMFRSGPHEDITNQALAALGIDPKSKFGVMISGYNVRADVSRLTAAEIHAQSPTFARTLQLLMSDIANGKCNTDRDRAVKAIKIGRALHLLQDFYSHTDWIDGSNLIPNYTYYRVRQFDDLGEAVIMNDAMNHNPHDSTIDLDAIYRGDFSEVRQVTIFGGGSNVFGTGSLHNRYSADNDGLGRDNPVTSGNTQAFETAKRLATQQTVEFFLWIQKNSECDIIEYMRVQSPLQIGP